MTIIGLDAGHAPSTPGKRVPSMQEWEFNHAVARLAKPMLEANGFTVVTAQGIGARADVPLVTRTNIYRSRGCRAIFSLHADASGDSRANGAWGFYWHNRSDSKRLADIWMKHLTAQSGIRSRGNRPSIPGTWSNFHMTRVPPCPSVLMEHAFMTNPNDLKRLKSASFRRACAIAVVRTACEYFGRAYKGGSAPAPAKTASKPSTVSTAPAPTKTASAPKTQWDWRGRFTANTTIVVRRGLGLNARAVPRNSYLLKGQYVDFDRLYMRDGYWWIRFKYPTNPSAGLFYMPVGYKRSGVNFGTANSKGALWGKVTNLKTLPPSTWRWSGRFTASTTIVVRRSNPSLSAPKVPRNSYLLKNQYVDFDMLYYRDKHWWIRFKYPTNPSAGYFYMPVGKKRSGVNFRTANEKGQLWGKVANLKTK